MTSGERPGEADAGAGPPGAAGGNGPDNLHTLDGVHTSDGVHVLDQTKVAAARLWATHRFPYLASALFASPMLAAPGLGRLTIDRWWRVHADPATVAEASVAQLGGELLHLSAHVLRAHAERADLVGLGQPAELHHWVDAADAEINDDFPADLDRVSAPVHPEALDSVPARLAEEYYRSGSVRPGSTNDCGSGSHGQPSLHEPPPDPDQRPGVTEHQAAVIRRQVADEVARADAPSAGMRAWADSQRQPQVDWRRELAAVLRRSLASVGGAVDYSYQRPSRRAGAVPDVVLPSLRQPTLEVAVVCDTSASVSDAQLGTALAEIDGLLRAAGVRSVRVLACDDAVRTASRVTRGRDVVALGGGGTDMGIGIEAAVDHRPRPQVVVVLTDGFTPWPSHRPGADVVVALLAGTGPGATPPATPAWARTVTIPAPTAVR